jgi:hypothetical protein
VVVYLDAEVAPIFREEAQRAGLSLSACLRERLTQLAIRPGREEYLHLALNTLLKYHEKGNLIEIVDQAWKRRNGQAHG